MVGARQKIFESKFILIITSAILYSIAFVFPAYFFWLIFFFLVPIFYGVERGMRFSFMHGFLWGCIFFCVHWYGLVQFILTAGLNDLRYVAVVFLILYWAVHAGVWFWCAQVSATFFGTFCVGRMVCWAATTWLYFIWLTYGMWWWAGRIEGDIFSFPLLPLTEYPVFLAALPYVTRYGLLACVLFFSIFFSLVVCTKKCHFFVLSLISVMPFFIGIFMDQAPIQVPSILKKMGYVSPYGIVEKHPLDRAQEITYRFIDLVQIFPEKKLVLMPESTYNFSLNDMPEIVEMWSTHALFDRVCVIGAHSQEGQKLFNSAFVLSNNVISQHYDKNKLTPFTEKVADWWVQFIFVKNIFLSGNNFCQGIKRCTFKLGQGFLAQPLICSELFLAEEIQKNESNVPYIILVNDAVFTTQALQHRLLQVAIFKAVEHQVAIIYVGHFFAAYIIPNGYFFLIDQVQKKSDKKSKC